MITYISYRPPREATSCTLLSYRVNNCKKYSAARAPLPTRYTINTTQYSTVSKGIHQKIDTAPEVSSHTRNNNVNNTLYSNEVTFPSSLIVQHDPSFLQIKTVNRNFGNLLIKTVTHAGIIWPFKWLKPSESFLYKFQDQIMHCIDVESQLLNPQTHCPLKRPFSHLYLPQSECDVRKYS